MPPNFVDVNEAELLAVRNWMASHKEQMDRFFLENLIEPVSANNWESDL